MTVEKSGMIIFTIRKQLLEQEKNKKVIYVHALSLNVSKCTFESWIGIVLIPFKLLFEEIENDAQDIDENNKMLFYRFFHLLSVVHKGSIVLYIPLSLGFF